MANGKALTLFNTFFVAVFDLGAAAQLHGPENIAHTRASKPLAITDVHQQRAPATHAHAHAHKPAAAMTAGTLSAAAAAAVPVVVRPEVDREIKIFISSPFKDLQEGMPFSRFFLTQKITNKNIFINKKFHSFMFLVLIAQFYNYPPDDAYKIARRT